MLAGGSFETPNVDGLVASALPSGRQLARANWRTEPRQRIRRGAGWSTRVQVTGLIDFMLAHVGPPESDISFALWVAGRTEQTAIKLDADRVRAFVAGYHRVRPLDDWASRAIPLYLVGRGLQMHVRMERAGVRDEVQSNRLHWLDANRRWLEGVVASALAPQPEACQEMAG